jgi:hypothetical protein
MAAQGRNEGARDAGLGDSGGGGIDTGATPTVAAEEMLGSKVRVVSPT